MNLRGTSWNTLKHYPSLIPLILCAVAGVSGALIFTARVAVKSPENHWNSKSRQEYWNEYAKKQYKLYSSPLAKSLYSQAPSY